MYTYCDKALQALLIICCFPLLNLFVDKSRSRQFFTPLILFVYVLFSPYFFEILIEETAMESTDAKILLLSPIIFFCLFLIRRYLQGQFILTLIWLASLLAICFAAYQVDCAIEQHKNLFMFFSICFAVLMLVFEKRLRSYVSSHEHTDKLL